MNSRKSLLLLVNRSFVFIVFLCGCLFLSSCTNPNAVSSGSRNDYPFAGDWQGSGIDSEGNEKLRISGYQIIRGISVNSIMVIVLL